MPAAVLNIRPAANSWDNVIDVVRIVVVCVVCSLTSSSAYRNWGLGATVVLLADFLTDHKAAQAAVRFLGHASASVQSSKAGCATKKALDSLARFMRKILPSMCVALVLLCMVLHKHVWVVRWALIVAASPFVVLAVLVLLRLAVKLVLTLLLLVVMVVVGAARVMKPPMRRVAGWIVDPIHRSVTLRCL